MHCLKIIFREHSQFRRELIFALRDLVLFNQDNEIESPIISSQEGATIALPPLESFGSGSLLSKTAPSVDSGISNAPVKRLVTIGTYLGFHTPSWFPKETGTGYKISDVLKPLEDMRSEFSLFSGLDHRAPNGHRIGVTF